MLSYRHAYHAGNIGDLVKHAVLSLVIDYLKQKPAPIRYIDTHAGAGLYSTRSAMAETTGEYQKGIGALTRAGLPVQLDALQSVLDDFVPRQQYPGSPLLAARLLRPQDELRLFELHSTDYPVLHDLFARDRRVQVSNSDGYASLKALLPVQNSRALVLIDPSYELPSDYVSVATSVEQGYRRMSHAVFAIWYPVVNQPALAILTKKITAIAQEKLWRFELEAASAVPDATSPGMQATGMFVINPPWTLARDLEAAFAAICPQLPFDNVRFTATCLKD